MIRLFTIILVVIKTEMYYNISANYLLVQGNIVCSGVRTSGSCATGCHEPCQAGNRAALSGFSCVPQQTCSSARPST